jgi:hypothetical protein
MKENLNENEFLIIKTNFNSDMRRFKSDVPDKEVSNELI